MITKVSIVHFFRSQCTSTQKLRYDKINFINTQREVQVKLFSNLVIWLFSKAVTD